MRRETCVIPSVLSRSSWVPRAVSSRDSEDKGHKIWFELVNCEENVKGYSAENMLIDSSIVGGETVAVIQLNTFRKISSVKPSFAPTSALIRKRKKCSPVVISGISTCMFKSVWLVSKFMRLDPSELVKSVIDPPATGTIEIPLNAQPEEIVNWLRV